jgi:mannitol/fructose-specific phosphotransferase system IIA component (Ntr-type)
VGLTVGFAALNLLGAKETTGVLRVFVSTLLGILAYFVLSGLATIATLDVATVHRERFTPFLPFGVDGLLGTVGLVAVSFAGLLKVASVSEEVRRPDRNLPAGMLLSLFTATAIYVLGVYVIVGSLERDTLVADLVPVASAAATFTDPLGSRARVLLVAVAAIAGFAATGNAGVLSASRYPLAMARDRLFPDAFARISRFGTPTAGVLLTATAMVVFIVVLDVAALAKLASAVLLLVLLLVNGAVIVMRESRIESYDPGFRAPLYPWLHLTGVLVPLFLIAEMGWLPVLFTVAVVGVGVAWYTYYGQGRLQREGAIYHVFERLGRRRFAGLDRELRDIMKEKGLREGDPFDVVIARAAVIDIEEPTVLSRVIRDAAARLHSRVPTTGEELARAFTRGVQAGGTPVSHGAALLHTRLPGFDSSEMVLVRCAGGIVMDAGDESMARQSSGVAVRAAFFLVSGESDPGRHLRILSQLASRIEAEDFLDEWLADRDEQELKETLLRDDRFLSVRLVPGTPAASLIGRSLRELQMPEGSLVAMIVRGGRLIVPRGGTVLHAGDRLTILGEPEGLRRLSELYDDGGPADGQVQATPLE